MWLALYHFTTAEVSRLPNITVITCWTINADLKIFSTLARCLKVVVDISQELFTIGGPGESHNRCLR